MNIRGDDLDMEEIIKTIQDEPVRITALEDEITRLKGELWEIRGKDRWKDSTIQRLQEFVDAAPTMDNYQREAMTTAIFGPVGHPSVVHFMNVFKSIGIVAERAKKTFRDKQGVFNDESKQTIVNEMEAVAEQMVPVLFSMNKPTTEKGNPLIYPVFGLIGEAGEVAEKLLKLAENPEYEMSWEEKEAVGYELSDVLWYITALAGELGFDLSDIAELNITKLRSRRERGKVQGEGDNR